MVNLNARSKLFFMALIVKQQCFWDLLYRDSSFIALDYNFLPTELRYSQKENILFLYHFWLPYSLLEIWNQHDYIKSDGSTLLID